MFFCDLHYRLVIYMKAEIKKLKNSESKDENSKMYA